MSSIPALARNGDPILAATRDLQILGLVGETDAALLVYVAYSSRKLAKPLSIIVKGPSGSGKDQVQRVPAQLIPSGDVKDFISITPKALYHGDPGWLSHKVVLGGERRHEDSSEARDKTAAMRQMISQGYITQATSKPLDGGGHYTEEIRQDGPVSYSETTTQDTIFNEDANRCFQVTTNTSREQTRAIINARADVYLEDSPIKRRKDAVKRHHEFQDALEAVPVKIPFARAVSRLISDDHVDMRRVTGQLFTLIECVAYLRQFGRRPDKDGSILATLDDYGVARRISAGPLAESRKKESEESKELESLPEKFSTSDALLKLGLKYRPEIFRKLNKWKSAGLVEEVSKGSGSIGATWSKTGRTTPTVILPTVEEIREMFGTIA